MLMRTALVTALMLVGCASGPNTGSGTTATQQRDPTQGADTGGLASATTGPSGAWLGARQREPAMAETVEARAERDRAISEQIGNAVLDEEMLSRASDVVITTQDGVVTLRGNVPTDFERARLDAAVRAIPGVSGIDNQVRVRPQRP